MNFEYRKGYFKALLDLHNFLEGNEDGLSINRMIPRPKNIIIRKLIKSFIENLDIVMKYGEYTNVLVKSDNTFVVQKEMIEHVDEALKQIENKR